MRIMPHVSNPHDYYDGGQRFNDEDNILYIRKEEELQDEFDTRVPFSRDQRSPFTIERYTIGFCGKVYPALRLNRNTSYGDPSVEKMCYTAADFTSFVEKNCKDKTITAYTANDDQFNDKRMWRYLDRGVRLPFVENFFTGMAEVKDRFAAKFLHHRSPILVYDYQKHPTQDPDTKVWVYKNMIANANLRKLEFFKLFNADQAYQELRMWMSNLAQPEKVIPVPDNKTMVEIKGFDPRYSFRKEPTKKR